VGGVPAYARYTDLRSPRATSGAGRSTRHEPKVVRESYRLSPRSSSARLRAYRSASVDPELFPRASPLARGARARCTRSLSERRSTSAEPTSSRPTRRSRPLPAQHKAYRQIRRPPSAARPEEWIPIEGPAIMDQDTFARARSSLTPTSTSPPATSAAPTSSADCSGAPVRQLVRRQRNRQSGLLHLLRNNPSAATGTIVAEPEPCASTASNSFGLGGNLGRLLRYCSLSDPPST